MTSNPRPAFLPWLRSAAGDGLRITLRKSPMLLFCLAGILALGGLTVAAMQWGLGAVETQAAVARISDDGNFLASSLPGYFQAFFRGINADIVRSILAGSKPNAARIALAALALWFARKAKIQDRASQVHKSGRAVASGFLLVFLLLAAWKYVSLCGSGQIQTPEALKNFIKPYGMIPGLVTGFVQALLVAPIIGYASLYLLQHFDHGQKMSGSQFMNGYSQFAGRLVQWSCFLFIIAFAVSHLSLSLDSSLQEAMHNPSPGKLIELYRDCRMYWFLLISPFLLSTPFLFVSMYIVFGDLQFWEALRANFRLIGSKFKEFALLYLFCRATFAIPVLLHVLCIKVFDLKYDDPAEDFVSRLLVFPWALYSAFLFYRLFMDYSGIGASTEEGAQLPSPLPT